MTTNSEATLQSVDTRIERLEISIRHLAGLVESGFETINDRFDRLETSMYKFENKTEQRQIKQRAKNRELSSRTKRLETFSSRMSSHTGIAF